MTSWVLEAFGCDPRSGRMAAARSRQRAFLGRYTIVTMYVGVFKLPEET